VFSLALGVMTMVIGGSNLRRSQSFICRMIMHKLPCLRRLVVDLSPLRLMFNSRTGHVGFVVDKLTSGQEFLPVLRSSLSLSFHQCSILIHSSITAAI
jgi:hypothetical protein